MGSGRRLPARRDWLSLNPLHRLPGDFQLLVGRDHENLDGTTILLELGESPGRPRILLVIHNDAKTRQAFTAAFPDRGRIFANSPGKDHGVHSPQNGKIGPDVFFASIIEDIHRQHGPGISPLGPVQNFPHVIDIADPRSTFPSFGPDRREWPDLSRRSAFP